MKDALQYDGNYLFPYRNIYPTSSDNSLQLNSKIKYAHKKLAAHSSHNTAVSRVFSPIPKFKCNNR